MKIHAAFVGVNRHADPSIRELTGAVRDARALWALFGDTMPDISGSLLVDSQATAAAVRHAISVTLEDAEADDVVIFTFAGHGTSNHRLVTYDTDLANLVATSIGMDELAESFQRCNARAIVCVLDCCFSGAAPARVIEGAPIPRGTADPYETIAGKGRILIAAAAPHEVAWEQPGTGHGLLTHALIEVLCGSQTDPVMLTSAFDEITVRTRAAAERIGETQTPVFVNHVEGGLTIPRLRRGPKFVAAFPEFNAQPLTGPVDELAAYGFPAEVINDWRGRFPGGLNALQLEAVNTHRILQDKSLLVIAPTSSGKTFIGELAAIRAVIAAKKAAFLLPYKALVNEKFDTFSEAYTPAGIRVVRCTGDYADQASLIVSGRYDFALFTYEMFLSLALGSSSVLSQLGAIVLDEGQFIADPLRGITVELIFALMIEARKRAIRPQLIMLSAVIGGVNALDAWLDSPCLVSTKRPVPLIEGVMDRTGTFEFLDIDGKPKTEQLLPSYEIRQRKEKPNAQDVVVPLAKQLVAQGEKLIVFRNVRGKAEGCAQYLANELGLPPVATALAELPTHDSSSSSERLRTCLSGGTAFHNANLHASERRTVERFFRDPKGGIAALGATTTLAAGINTPASTVILAEQEFIGDDGRPFTIAEYKNMIGRAGRLGFSEIGKSIVLAETPIERRNLFRKYVLGLPEAARSSFADDELPTWILRLLSQVRRVPARDVITLLLNTFGGYLLSRRDPHWQARVQPRLEQLLTRMATLDLAERDGEFISLTLLGKACGRSSLSFDSALRLVELLKLHTLDRLSAIDLVPIVLTLAEADASYIPVMKRGQAESARVSDVARRYGGDAARLLQRFAGENVVYWGRCKKAAIVWDWIHGDSVGDIEKRYSPNPFQGNVSYGDIIRAAELTRFNLRSAHQIISILLVENQNLLEDLDKLLLQLEFGCPDDALNLLKLPIPLTRGELLALRGAGLISVDAVRNSTSERLTLVLGKATAERLWKAFPKTMSAGGT
jgi:helicase